MADPRPLTLDSAREKFATLQRRRSEAIEGYKSALTSAVTAKQTFREAKAKAYVVASAEGGTAEQKKLRADELASDAEAAMGMADATVKVAKEVIDAIEADRAMLNAFIAWSKDLNRQGVQ